MSLTAPRSMQAWTSLASDRIKEIAGSLSSATAASEGGGGDRDGEGGGSSRRTLKFPQPIIMTKNKSSKTVQLLNDET